MVTRYHLAPIRVAKRYFLHTFTLCAIALLPLQNHAQRVKLDVFLLAAVPDQLFLEQHTMRGWSAIDSTWPANDGLYHLDIKHFQPGLYQLRLAQVGAMPLLLTEYEKTLAVCMQGPNFVRYSSVANSKSTNLYLQALALREHVNYWNFLATQASKIEDVSPSSLATIASLASTARLRLNRYIDSCASATSDTLLRHFLYLSDLYISSSANEWWPKNLLQDTLIAHTDELRLHSQDYFYAQIQDDYSRPQLDSAFAHAVRTLARLPMHPVVAQRLRAYTLLFFTNTNYPDAARIAMLEPFGPLASSPLFAPNAQKQLTPTEALATRVKDLSGRDIPLINQKANNTLVVFWSVWCPHCQTLLPQIHEWWKTMPYGSLDILAVSIDHPGKALSTHINLKNWGWRNAIEKDNEDSDLLKKIGFDGTPQLVLFDQHGNTITQPQTLTQLKNQF